MLTALSVCEQGYEALRKAVQMHGMLNPMESATEQCMTSQTSTSNTSQRTETTDNKENNLIIHKIIWTKLWY